VTPRTILHVIPTLNVGGAEKQLALLLQGLDRRRFRSLVACTTSAGPLAAEISSAGVGMRVFGKRRGADPALLWRLGRWMRREQPDLIHTWMFTANTWGRLAALLGRTRARIVCSERCVDLWKRSIHRCIDRILAPATDRFLVNSRAVADFLTGREGIPAGRIRVIPNGIDPLEARRLRSRPGPEVAALRRELGIPPGAPAIGDVSRLDAKNDLMTWLDVVDRLASRHPELVALHAGSAVLPVEEAFARRFEAEIDRRGLRPKVRLLGLRRDLERVLPALDLFLHTSTMEGFPNSIMEAMAAGLPVVATAAGGTPELVLDGKTGHLAPVRDAAALARCAAELLADPARRRLLGDAGARRVETHFSAQRMVRSTEEAYDEVLSA